MSLSIFYFILWTGIAIGANERGWHESIPQPFDAEKYDFEFIHNFTRYLHKIYRFNSFVTFSKDRVRNRPSYVLVRSLEHALVDDFNVPIIVWGVQRSEVKLRNHIGLNNLVFVEFHNFTDPILDVVDEMLEGLHFISILFFYKHKDNLTPTSEQILGFFNWCWERNMVNVALTFQLIVITSEKAPGGVAILVFNQVYNYSPFPKLAVHNLTDEVRSGTGGGFIVNYISDVKGYTFKTPTYRHPPYVFLIPHDPRCGKLKYCSEAITGIAGRLYNEYIKQVHGTIEIEPLRNLTGDEMENKILFAAAKKAVDIGIHPFSELLMNLSLSHGSYPLAQTNVCIIVPMVRGLPSRQFIMRPFQPGIWALVVLTFVSLTVLQVCFTQGYAPFSRNPIMLCGYAFMSTMSMLFNQTLVNEFLFKRSTVYKIFHMLILVMTFVMSNMYTASLTSLLSSTPFGVQIDTVADFLASDLTILVGSYDRPLFFDTGRLPRELIPRLQVVNEQTVALHRESLNTSYAYLALGEEWQMLNTQQQHLRKPLFHMPSKELCTAPFFIRFPLQWDSPFTLSLALFLLAAQESGLSSKWQELSMYQATQLKFVPRIKNDIEPWLPLDMAHFVIVASFVLGIWLLALICFASELIWYRITKKQQQQKRSIRKREVKIIKK